MTPPDLTLVLKNIISHVRYSGYTSKEILFCRNTLSNTAIDVKDKDILDVQKQNRTLSSTYGRKHTQNNSPTAS